MVGLPLLVAFLRDLGDGKLRFDERARVGQRCGGHGVVLIQTGKERRAISRFATSVGVSEQEWPGVGFPGRSLR